MSAQSHSYCQALEHEEEGPVGIAPYRLFETKDELIFVGAATDKFWRILCEVLGVPELADEPRYATNPQRAACQAELTERLQPYFRQKTAAEWETILTAHGFPCGIVATHRQFFDHPQVSAMQMNPVVQHPIVGPLRLAGVPIHFEKTPGGIQRAAPTLGQHTDEVLRELGYADEQIEALRRDGIISPRSPRPPR
jgi:crotonobetainyl-CoA:carnitine CoA-transferase CaiB-like acyl-CoA transferase